MLSLSLSTPFPPAPKTLFSIWSHFLFLHYPCCLVSVVQIQLKHSIFGFWKRSRIKINREEHWRCFWNESDLGHFLSKVEQSIGHKYFRHIVLASLHLISRKHRNIIKCFHSLVWELVSIDQDCQNTDWRLDWKQDGGWSDCTTVLSVTVCYRLDGAEQH